jgi:hypothetical protein
VRDRGTNIKPARFRGGDSRGNASNTKGRPNWRPFGVRLPNKDHRVEEISV